MTTLLCIFVSTSVHAGGNNNVNFTNRSIISNSANFNQPKTTEPKKSKPIDLVDQLNSSKDPQSIMLSGAGFETIHYEIEPLPTLNAIQENVDQAISISRLVQVDHIKLMTKTESQSIFDQRSRFNDSFLSKHANANGWLVATGITQGEYAQVIVFLVPPEITNISNDDHLMVEISDNKSLSIARYVNER